MNMFRTSLLALGLLAGSLTADAVCNRVPQVTFATDGTPEGVIALVSWEDCDGDSWRVCSRTPRYVDNGEGCIQILPACDVYLQSGFSVRQGEPTHYVVLWLDGPHAGERYIVDIIWP